MNIHLTEAPGAELSLRSHVSELCNNKLLVCICLFPLTFSIPLDICELWLISTTVILIWQQHHKHYEVYPQGPSVELTAAVVQSHKHPVQQHIAPVKPTYWGLFRVVEKCSFIRVNNKQTKGWLCQKRLFIWKKQAPKSWLPAQLWPGLWESFSQSNSWLSSSSFQSRAQNPSVPLQNPKSESSRAAPLNANDTYCKTTVQLLLQLKSCCYNWTRSLWKVRKLEVKQQIGAWCYRGRPPAG